MQDRTALVLVAIVFAASVLSIELGLSAAILEIVLGALAGNVFRLQRPEWLAAIAGFGGILLTFLAGAEVDLAVMRRKALASFAIGVPSFLAPFLGTLAVCRWGLGWETAAAAIAGIALSTTSLAVVYAVLVETGLTRTEVGKVIMAATFVTDFATAAGLTLLFVAPTRDTAWFGLVSLAIIGGAPFVLPRLFRRYGDRVIEPEIKLLFLLLVALAYFAHAGRSHAILPAFVLGLVLSNMFRRNLALQRKLRAVAFAFITPIFFLNGGLNLSAPMLAANLGLFALLLAVKLITKGAGVYPVARAFLPREAIYTTLLMSTGLTMGTISATYGYENGIVDQAQFSVLVAVVVASAVVPTFFAQRWFHPRHALEAMGAEVEPEWLDTAGPPQEKAG